MDVNCVVAERGNRSHLGQRRNIDARGRQREVDQLLSLAVERLLYSVTTPGVEAMSTGAIKGVEVLLIAGVVFWFAYSQLNALKRTKPTATEETEKTQEDKQASNTEEPPRSDTTR
jgi:hypothetical protein